MIPELFILVACCRDALQCVSTNTEHDCGLNVR